MPSQSDAPKLIRGKPFKEGHIPWNKDSAVYISKSCKFCNKEFKVLENQYKRGRGIFCSKECKDNFEKDLSKRDKIKNLYSEGKTYKEISEIINVSIPTIGSYIYVMNLQDRFGDGIISESSKQRIKTLLKEQGICNCELCSYSRVVEVAHVYPKRKGGKYLLDNCLLLCPNCHYLFDYNLLNIDEINKLHSIDRINWKKGE